MFQLSGLDRRLSAHGQKINVWFAGDLPRLGAGPPRTRRRSGAAEAGSCGCRGAAVEAAADAAVEAAAMALWMPLRRTLRPATR